MKRISAIISATVFFTLAAAGGATTHDFYKGKTIRIIVGLSAGGGFDTYSRVIARHLGKHIPNSPAVVVDNMTGAGGLVSANHLYKVAKPDGLTIGNFPGGLFLQQLFDLPGIEFDARKFEYLGAPTKEHFVCAVNKSSGVTSMEKWAAAGQPVKLGGDAPGSNPYNVPAILKEALRLPIQLISGYKGTSQIRLAAESGEVDGGCWSWESLKVTWKKGIESGAVNVLLQVAPKPHPELSNVPLAISYAKTDEGRDLIRAGLHDMSTVIRNYTLPPGTPKDRIQLLRNAFMITLKDPEFVAEATRANLEIDPTTGEELEKTINGLFKVNPTVVAKLKDVFAARK